MSEAVIVALITLVGVVVTAGFGFLAAKNSRSAAKHASAINDAVNHRHAGEPRLLDVVKEIRQHQKLFDDRIDILSMKLDMTIQHQAHSDARIQAVEDHN